jgi:cytochrome c553
VRLKRVGSRLAALILLGALGALLFAWSGLYNVAATAGHWPAVAWLLGYTMKNSVELHALPIAPPPLGDVALIERGAGHYETGCAPCHGAPGWSRNRIPRNMLPQPPYLPPQIDKWSETELFRLVKHGLKYTGMPSWPAAGRDDEVWAVIAFLLRLPAMDAEEYALLALGTQPSEAADETASPDSPGTLFALSDAALIGACARCHGADGRGRVSGAFPRLDIQTPDYLYRALRDYAEGNRASGIMEPIAAALGEDQAARLARHYSRAANAPMADGEPVSAAEQALLDRGLEIAAIGIPESQLPPCSACHGLAEGPANPLFPALAGQYPGHLRLQLDLWKAEVRGDGAYSQVMQAVAARLSAADIEAVARYYASLSPAVRRTEAATGQAGPEEPAR